MCPSIVETRSVTSEIRRKKRKKKETRRVYSRAHTSPLTLNHSDKIQALRHHDAMRAS